MLLCYGPAIKSHVAYFAHFVMDIRSHADFQTSKELSLGHLFVLPKLSLLVVFVSVTKMKLISKADWQNIVFFSFKEDDWFNLWTCLVNHTCSIVSDNEGFLQTLTCPQTVSHRSAYTMYGTCKHAHPSVFLFLCLSHALSPFSLLTLRLTHTHTQGDTRGRVDAALSALRWGVLLLTAVWIEAAVHPLLSGCCRAAGLAFVLHSIMARHNYSLSRDGTQAVSTLPLASLHLAEQHRHKQAHTSFM